MPTLSRRQEARLTQAVAAVNLGESIRSASQRFRVKRSTLGKYKARGGIIRFPAGRRPMLSEQKEQQLVSMLLRHAQHGIPLTQRHLVEGIRFMLKAMSPAHRHILKITDVDNYTPSPSFMLSFRKRHRSILKFGRPSAQEAKRFRAVNGNVLANHFATLEKLLHENNMGPEHIFNLDECGVTPDKDCGGRLPARRFLPARTCNKQRTDIEMAEFDYKHRVTMMPVVSAAGVTGPPLFVFSGTRVQYEVIEADGIRVPRPVTHRLPTSSCIATRDTLGGVDTRNFLSWAHEFVKFTWYLRQNRQKILLVFDGYRAHLSPPVLELFHANDIIVYALPSHTSGKLQPLDCAIFSAFKSALRSITADMVLMGDEKLLDQADLCSILRAAYNRAFTQDNIKAGFRNSGLYPLDHTRVTCQPRPESHACDASIISVMQLEAKVNMRRAELRTAVLGEDAKLCTSGWIDTSHGCVMTSHAVLGMVREKARIDESRVKAKERERVRKELRAAMRESKTQADVNRLKYAQLQRRAALFNETIEDFLKRVRPLKVRIAIAKVRAQNRRG